MLNSKEKYQRQKAQQKAYREANSEWIAEKRAVKFVCTCGQEIAKWSKTYHLRSKYHIENAPQ